MEQEEFIKRRKKALRYLSRRYPRTFRWGDRILPLEIGIDKKLLIDVKNDLSRPSDVSLRMILKALRYYIGKKQYQAALRVAGNPRINLQGEMVGRVTPEEAKLHIEKGHRLNKMDDEHND